MSSVVLISGASTGFGRLTAQTLARAGHTVYASMRDISTGNAGTALALHTFGDEHEVALRTLEMDICDTASVLAAVDTVLRDAGRIDAVVNNAGLMSIGVSEAFTEEQVRHQMDVNFMGGFRLSRAVLPHLRAQRSGLIIHATSIVGRILFPACAFYCASKFAQEAFAEVLNYELVGTGVRASSSGRAHIRQSSWRTARRRQIPSDWRATASWPPSATSSSPTSRSSLRPRRRRTRRMWPTPCCGSSSCRVANGRCARCAAWTSAPMGRTK